MWFLRRWQKMGGLPSPPTLHNMVVESRENLSLERHGLRERRMANWITCNIAVGGGWFSSSPKGKRPAPKAAALWQCLGGRCCVSADQEGTAVYCLWILGILTMKNLTNNELRVSVHLCGQFTSEFSGFKKFNSPPWQNCVIPSLCLFAPPSPNFKTTKRGGNTWKTAKALILVCYSDGEILQVDTELDISFSMRRNVKENCKSVIWFVCVCCFCGKHSSPSRTPSVWNASFITWDLLSFSRCWRVW